jgi:RNA dependent RNA polymerase
LLEELLGGQKVATQAVAIQVRILIPSMGLYKGMLHRKHINSGPSIQLVETMRKVDLSTQSCNDQRACLMITKNGVHPNQTNDYVDRLLDPNRKPPPKSFKIKPLSEMITRLWQGLGVPKALCDDYVKKSVKHQHLNHGWVVGLADPSNGSTLPNGHVFVTGMRHHLEGYEKIFVTRSPCISPKDGRMCPIVTTKPHLMTSEEWDDLNSRPFGSIIFASPKGESVPLPEIIAGGDLDGDLYFICWHYDILQEIKAEPIMEEIVQTIGKPSKCTANEFWFEDAQQLAQSTMNYHAMGCLTGKLYTLSHKAADESAVGIHDPDAIAFGDAFKNALDFAKHGGRIELPLHLHERIPESLQKYLTTP